MNKRGNHSEMEHLRSLQILNELAENDSLTQRDISKRLGFALGLVNSYIKNLVRKGYIVVRSVSPKRYVYFLTPKGFTEKSRLTFQLLGNYTRVYREARNSLKDLFLDLKKSGNTRVVFAGADEVGEIAYLTLKETGLELAGIVDADRAGREFFETTVGPLEAARDMEFDCIIITSYLRRDAITRQLLSLGIDKDLIKRTFPD